MQNKLTQTGLDFIKKWEGLRLKPYKDAAGLSTIGYGHLIKPGEGERFKGGISEIEATEILRQDAAHAEHVVSNLVKVDLNQNQFNALVSFVFNVGAAHFAMSSLLRELNKGHYEKVHPELRRWTRAGGREVVGLKNRRMEEAELWSS